MELFAHSSRELEQCQYHKGGRAFNICQFPFCVSDAIDFFPGSESSVGRFGRHSDSHVFALRDVPDERYRGDRCFQVSLISTCVGHRRLS